MIAAEGLRAFKRTTILGYEIPWNNFDFAYQAYFALEQSHIERKVAALSKYASQQHRRYSDPEYIRNVARTHGINVNREFRGGFRGLPGRHLTPSGVRLAPSLESLRRFRPQPKEPNAPDPDATHQ